MPQETIKAPKIKQLPASVWEWWIIHFILITGWKEINSSKVSGQSRHVCVGWNERYGTVGAMAVQIASEWCDYWMLKQEVCQ